VCGKTDRLFGRREAKLTAHGAVQPWAGVDQRRRRTLVEPAQDHEIGLHQPALELTENADPCQRRCSRPDRAARHEHREQGWVGGRWHGAGYLGRKPELADELVGAGARFLGPQLGAVAGRVGCEPLGECQVGGEQFRQRCLDGRGKAEHRGGRIG
jgi:hypothetical protein